MSENTPHSIAAGVVYFISQLFNLNVTKKDVQGVSEISPVTINKCYKRIETMTHLLVPKQFLESINK